MAAADLEVVIAALQEGGPAESLSARAMLCAALPHALAPVAAGTELHPYQLTVLGDVRRAFEDLRTAGQAAISSAGDDVVAARHTLAEAEATVVCAAAALEEARAATDAAKAQKEAHEAKVREAEEELARTEVSTQADIDRRAQVIAELDRTRTVAEALERAEDAGGPMPADDVSGLLVAFLEERRAEKALIVAVPASVGIPAAARSEFDHFTVQEARRFVAGAVQGLEAKLEEGAADAANAEAERLGSWAMLDVERDRAAEIAEGVAAAEAKFREAEAAREAASAAVSAQEDALSAKLIAETLAGSRAEELARASEVLERLARPPAPAPEAPHQQETAALAPEVPSEQQVPTPAAAQEPETPAEAVAVACEQDVDTAMPPAQEETEAWSGEQDNDVAMAPAQEETEATAGDESMTEVTEVAAKSADSPIRAARDSLSIGGA